MLKISLWYERRLVIDKGLVIFNYCIPNINSIPENLKRKKKQLITSLFFQKQCQIQNLSRLFCSYVLDLEKMKIIILNYQIGVFQLKFVCISWIINHMTFYKFKCSHWWKLYLKKILYKICSSLWMLYFQPMRAIKL